MMKTLRLILLSPLLVGSHAVTPLPTIYNFDNFYMEQFNTKNKPTEIYFEAFTLRSDPLTVKMYVVNDKYPDGALFWNKTYSGTISEKVVYNNEYTRSSNNEILIKYQTKSSNVELRHAVSINYGQTVKLNDVSYQYKSTSKYLMYTKADGWKESNEIIEFNNFSDVYVPNYYHKIDFSLFTMKIIGNFPKQLPFEKVTLTITNRNGAFDNLKHSGDYAEVSLKIVKNGKQYHLAFQDALYVDPLTLKMSLSPNTGYVKTEYLYFPRNEKRYEETYTCLITLKGLGMDFNTFSLNFKYKSVYNIIGDCHNSEYCVRAN